MICSCLLYQVLFRACFVITLGKGAKKIEEKNLTSVSFAFTHTYTAVKTNSLRFFPQAYMENFEKCAKTGNMGTLGGGGGANSPL